MDSLFQIKSWLFPVLKTEYGKQFTILKKGNRYQKITTPTCIYLDVMQYVAQGIFLFHFFLFDEPIDFHRVSICIIRMSLGTSLSDFLSYWLGNDDSERKLKFPYLYLRKTEQLKEEQFPALDCFNTTLCDVPGADVTRLTCPATRRRMLCAETCSPEEWEKMRDMYIQKGCKNLGEWLHLYNIQDVEPFHRAVKNFSDTFRNTVGVDLFTSGFVSLPGVSVHVANESIKPTRASEYFHTLGPIHKHIVEDMRMNLIGGYSSVFNRQHHAGVTRTREIEERVLTGEVRHNQDAPFCQTNDGFDST